MGFVDVVLADDGELASLPMRKTDRLAGMVGTASPSLTSIAVTEILSRCIGIRLRWLGL